MVRMGVALLQKVQGRTVCASAYNDRTHGVACVINPARVGQKGLFSGRCFFYRNNIDNFLNILNRSCFGNGCLFGILDAFGAYR